MLLVFRLTCYYYRKAYYRSFWLSPPACAVSEPHRNYTGETRLPLILQNAHRYTFYAALIITLINTYDAILAFSGEDGFGIGLGNVILVGNVIMLWAYTLSCHSCRHVTGGRLRSFSRHPDPVPMVDVRVQAERPAHAVRVDHPGHARDHRRVHPALAAGWITDLRFLN